MGKKILNSKWIYAVLSVLLAFVLWLYVGQEANPDVTDTLGRVQVVFSGLESLEERGLMISEGAEQTVSLRIRATREVWNRLNQGDTTVSIDASTGILTLSGSAPTEAFAVTISVTTASGQTDSMEVTCQIVSQLIFTNGPSNGVTVWVLA